MRIFPFVSVISKKISTEFPHTWGIAEGMILTFAVSIILICTSEANLTPFSRVIWIIISHGASDPYENTCSAVIVGIFIEPTWVPSSLMKYQFSILRVTSWRLGDIGFPALSRSLRTPTEVDPAMIVFDIGWNSILVQSHARGGREDQDVAEIVFGSPIVPAQQAFKKWYSFWWSTFRTFSIIRILISWLILRKIESFEFCHFIGIVTDIISLWGIVSFWYKWCQSKVCYLISTSASWNKWWIFDIILSIFMEVW